MSGTRDVRIWNIADRRKDGGQSARPWVVRWRVAEKRHESRYRTSDEADGYRSELLVAQRNNEMFSRETGEPISWEIEPSAMQAHEWVRQYVAEQWEEWAPRTRQAAVESLSRFVHLLVPPAATPNEGIRVYLKKKGLSPDGDREEAHEAWLAKWCYPLNDLTRLHLAEADRVLGLKLDGTAASANTATRNRTNARSCIRRAVDLEILAKDPWPPVQRGAKRRKVNRKKKSVDVQRLPGPKDMQRALGQIPNFRPESQKYFVMTATAYYAGLRPSEIVMLRPKALTLPTTGWGEIAVTESDIDFDEPGEPKEGDRSVPIPRKLVDIFIDWLDAGDFQQGDLLFRTRHGNRPTHSNWGRAWKRALKSAEMEPLSIYDCRHAAATTWLAAGVPLGEAALRLGHSVETLVSHYVGALEDHTGKSNRSIDAALDSES